ncbi:Hypothetical_protein [Hexamita inflata]|uniref:Hypothetical_protein n=1 Tax=Hexamita inflata TaxID=28002 RepID=A0AA86TCI9_9EUKA|nr:Hypothetical protein HINF_LOCUS1710 [Hexamita inflata]
MSENDQNIDNVKQNKQLEINQNNKIQQPAEQSKQHDYYLDSIDLTDYYYWDEDSDQELNHLVNTYNEQENVEDLIISNNQQPELKQQLIAQDLFPNVFNNLNNYQTDQENKQPEKQTEEVQNSISRFKELILEAINDYFKKEGKNDLKTDSLRQALINYRQYYAEVKRIHLDLRQIAAQLGLTEKQVSQMFRTLQDNELDDWPKEKIQAVQERAQELRQMHPELNKAQLRAQLDQEFGLINEYSLSPKKIANRISFILKKLFE